MSPRHSIRPCLIESRPSACSRTSPAFLPVEGAPCLEPARFHNLLTSLPLPLAADGRIALAVDVPPWLRPDAPTPDRMRRLLAVTAVAVPMFL